MAEPFKIVEMDDTAIVATGTVDWIIDCRMPALTVQENAPRLADVISLSGKVVSATNHREVKIEMHEGVSSTDIGEGAITIVSDWHSGCGDTDGRYYLDVSRNASEFIKLTFTGLTNCAATLTDFQVTMV